MFKNYPDVNEIVSYCKNTKSSFANLHIHTPYSFSAFRNVAEAIELARNQNVVVLGISDFNTTQGYEEFTEECLKAKVFPAYGMETIALSVDDQKSGARWNDPNNPGRIYFCGKAFQYPLISSQKTLDILAKIANALDNQVRQMIAKLNNHLKNVLPEIQLDYGYILKNMTNGTVRERHIAKALQQELMKKFPDINDRAKAVNVIYGKDSQVDISNEVLLQEELRSNLLKAGKVAFVEESPDAYLDIDTAKNVMLDMGGIPCYPVLVDGTKGELTEIEKDPESLCNMLIEKGIYCAEFIPARNDINILKNYVSVFKDKGMMITAGTEHNTPMMEPIYPRCKGDVPLNEFLKETFWKGACVVVAHQYLVSKGLAGYVDSSGNRTDMAIEKLESIGEGVILYYLSK
ncbi:MAG: PHP domain-containing protein [Candidatus Poribacteria bacterium]